ncbi:MAG TPA: mevalonate kinase [Methanothrix sp.]|nr:mevalonate kinase [Methanothrix sp.]
MTAASAPGKVILFGEHAVVSGFPALGGAIDLRARAKVLDCPGKLLIETEGLFVSGFSLDLLSGQVLCRQASHAARYVSAVLREFDASDLSIKIESSIPPASGLGSSAAITVACLAAVSRHLGHDLPAKEVAALSHRIEKTVQNGLGSPMDTALATFGGYLRVCRQVEPLALPPLQMVVGDTGKPHDTRQQVAGVQALKERYPDLVNPIFQAIGAISSRAAGLIEEQNLSELGALMNANHGLLEALGVGSRELSELVYAARNSGALGAKITGAGGGGCMIALPGPGNGKALIAAMRQARGRAFPAVAGCEGVRMEADT